MQSSLIWEKSGKPNHANTSRPMKAKNHKTLPLTLALATLMSHSSVTQPAQAASFTNTGPMATAREVPTATLLPSGKVLVAGGGSGGGVFFQVAELYDSVCGNLDGNRSTDHCTCWSHGHVAAKRTRVGRGRADHQRRSFQRRSWYDPATGMWTLTGALGTARGVHTATLLLNGRVLVVGGIGSNGNALLFQRRAV